MGVGRSKGISQWSNLPPDLIVLICGKLADITDYIRLRAVCTTWRSAAGTIINPIPQLPWLMLPYDPRRTTRSFFSLASNRVYSLDLPETRGKIIICGSSHGWLVMRDVNTASLSLLNPVTRSHIPLPPITKSAINGASLSSNPKNDCIVTVTFNYGLKFAFCRVGSDDGWTFLDAASALRSSIAAAEHHEGRFYVIDILGNSVAIDAAPPFEHTSVLWSPVLNPFSSACQMVKSGGELLLVAVSLWNSVDVFRLEQRGQLVSRWSKVGSLRSGAVRHSSPNPPGFSSGGMTSCFYCLMCHPVCDCFDGDPFASWFHQGYLGEIFGTHHLDPPPLRKLDTCYEIYRMEICQTGAAAVKKVDGEQIRRHLQMTWGAAPGFHWIMPSFC